jgi:hypothetical protein
MADARLMVYTPADEQTRAMLALTRRLPAAPAG